MHIRTRTSPGRARRGRRLGTAVTVLLSLVTLLLLGGATSSSAAPGAAPAAGCQGTAIDKTVKGTLKNSAADDTPVPDVKITVTNCDGKEFVGATDEAGNFEIPFTSGLGPVRVTIDPDTLPEGVELRTDKTTNVITGSLSTINTAFPIGPDNRKLETKWDRVPDLIYSGLLFGLVLALAALGLNMIFGTTGLTNFAHGELISLGAILAFYLSSGIPLPFTDNDINLPFLVAAPLAVVLGMLFGWLLDSRLWRPLRDRGIGLIAAMIVSIGLQFFLRNMYAYVTGSRFQTYDEFYTPVGKDFHGLFTYTTRDIVVAGTCIVVLVVVILGLSYTRIGRATRAVADNPALAASTGINVDRVISVVWIVGTGLAALAGVFLGFQLGVTYQIGQLVLLLLFAAICVGGLGSIWGAVLGSLLIGVLIDLSTLFINADLKNAGALLLLIVILLVRPQGLLGRRERIG
ncbi:branched-chain amino acid ABC transporter permease [Nocardioides rubriscoriae]|uniref:branched-chain amino acid ABC transporter permease n=1 Tax=Nocardioides rubriscoriae TaxID=642762 RepID=UPI00147972E6|nr:branched-chain amino acid ABC transporter permease [Nocardioides rubriscoriae]